MVQNIGEIRPVTAAERAVVGALGEVRDRVSRLESTFRQAFQPAVARAKSTGAAAFAVLDAREGRAALQVEIYVKSSGPATFYVEGSADGQAWRDLYTLVITEPAGGKVHEGFGNAYPLVRVRTEDVGDHEIEIVGGR